VSSTGRPTCSWISVVALKVVASEYAQDAAFSERFKRESRLAASLKHPNVIPIYQAGEEDGRLYVTMQLVDGTDLADVLDRDGRLDPERAARITAQVAAALDAAHARGLVHRDVKPANILLEGDQVFLTDFGLSKDVRSETGLTETGTFLGTVDYVAPEQAQGGVVDVRSDVYSLGCVLYQMLSGHVPFERSSAMAKLVAHATDDPPPLTDVPEPLAAVVARALEKEPGRRFQSAGELAEAAAGALGYSLPAGMAERRRRERRPMPWTRIAAVLVAGAVIAGGIALLAGGGSGAHGNDERAAVSTAVKGAFTGVGKNGCTRFMTPNFLERFFAPRKGADARAACAVVFADTGDTPPLQISSIAIEGSNASARANILGHRRTVLLAKRSGHWLVNDFTETPNLRYFRQITTALVPVLAYGGEFENRSSPLTRDNAAPVLSDGRRAFSEALASVKQVQPPSGSADLHARLIAAINDTLAAIDHVRGTRTDAAFKAAMKQYGKASDAALGILFGEIARAE
jgi:hypothetical protein